MKLLIEADRTIDGVIIYITLFKLHKSYLLLVSDQKNRGIGTVTLSSPPTIEGLKSTSASYGLFGIKNKLLSTIIVEKTSFLLKTPVLLLLFLKSKIVEKDILKPIINFLNEKLLEIIEKSNSKSSSNER